MHTSTITVAVLNPNIKRETIYHKQDDKDFRFEYFKSSGAGGQHRNKTTSGVKCIHIPTGMKQERTSKCQHRNKKESKQALIEMLNMISEDSVDDRLSDIRKDQVGTGQRGDKIRTYRFQDNMIVDHITGKSITVKDFEKGMVDKIW